MIITETKELKTVSTFCILPPEKAMSQKFDIYMYTCM